MVNVKIVGTCPRCGKKQEEDKTLEAATIALEVENKREESIDMVRELIESIPVEDRPDIIIGYRHPEADAYTIKSMYIDNLCVNTQTTKHTGCVYTVDRLLKDLLRVRKTKGHTPADS